MTLDAGYRLDLVVNDSIIIEIKAVEALSRLHEAQILTYLRVSGLGIGFLMNFNVVTPLFKQGDCYAASYADFVSLLFLRVLRVNTGGRLRR